ncbi:MAG: SET domain-containing protein-lysine N-methyltransferase [Bacteroidota bacterium]
MLHIPGLYIADTDHGRGVYTGIDISRGDIIERCPIIKIPTGQLRHINPTILYEYYFLWQEEGVEACIALGYGSLYNHSPTPNAEIILDHTDDHIVIQAIQNISPTTEIRIDYTGATKGEIELWF